MRKKIVIIVILVLLLGLSIGLLLWLRSNEDVQLKKATFQYEYGQVIDLDGKEVLDTKESSILKSFEVEYSNLRFEKKKKYPKVGNYTIEAKYRINGFDKKQSVTLIVKDTTKPEFTKFADTIEIDKNGDVHNLHDHFEAKDLNSFEIMVNTDKVDVSTVGEYEIEVSAIDKYKNKNVKKAVVVVVNNEVVIPKQPDNVNSETPPNNNVVATPSTVRAPTYINGIMIVNKKNPVPQNYAPYENAEAGSQLRSLIKEMQSLGYNINSSYSGFRSFDTQARLYQNYVKTHGQIAADTFSARPGYSEHQTGLAFDLLHTNGALVENMEEANWISQNAHRYGFIVRYKAGKEHITGYQAEPWHIRFVGSSATDIYNSGLTLEEYLGAQGGSY